MKHIQLFEQFIEQSSDSINEGLDPDVAKAILKVAAGKKFDDGLLYMSLDERDKVKRLTGGKRMTGAPGPEKGVYFTTILNAIAGKDKYYKDGTDLVVGDKTVADLTQIKTFGDLKKFR